MKFVLEDFIYACTKSKLPTNCYYFDSKRSVFVGKFSNLHVILYGVLYMHEIIELKELSIHDEYEISEEMNDFSRNLDLYVYDYACTLRDDCGRISVPPDSYITFLYRSKKQIEIIKTKILDFYIKHKPNTTKSSR